MRSHLERLLYVGPFDFPQRNAAAQLVEATARALISAGNTVTVVGRATEGINLGERHAIAPGVEAILASRASRPASIAEAWNTVRATATQLRRGDVQTIVVYNAPSLTLLFILCLGRIRGITVVGHCTEWYLAPPLRPRAIRSLIKRADITLRMRVLHKLASGLILSSEYLRTYYKRQKTLVVPTLSPRQEVVHETDANAVPVVVYAGVPFEGGRANVQPHRMKDRLDLALEWLADIAREGIPFRFDIYGISRDEYLMAVPRHGQLLGEVGEFIEFHGRVHHGYVARAVACADFTLLVRDESRHTLAGFPTKVTESLIGGTPPIASAVGDTKNYIEHGVTGFLLPKDRQESARIVRLALSAERSRRAWMKRQASEFRALEPEAWGQCIATFLSECSEARTR